MIEMTFHPTLEQCIQTLTKKAYERLMQQLLASEGEDADAGERLEMLKAFLETHDFNQIRSEYEPYLAEGKAVMFTLWNGPETTECKWEVK